MALELTVQLFSKNEAGFSFEMHRPARDCECFGGVGLKTSGLLVLSPVIFHPEMLLAHWGWEESVSSRLDALVGLKRILDSETGGRKPDKK